jgi:hypothetical protein
VFRGLDPRRQRHRHRAPLQTRDSSQVHEVGGAACFGARQTHTSAPRRIPQGVEKALNRTTWCKTMAQSAHGGLRRERAERQTDSGYGRSMAEAVTALCPTILQNRTSGAGTHTRAKPVLAGFTAVIWLKGALHGASYGTSSNRARSEQLPCTSGARRKQTTG